jgi:CHAD domain-containing protein
LQRALREARRALGAARDQAVAPDAMSSIQLDDADRETAKTIMAATASLPGAEIKQLLAEGAARAAAQVEALEAALPETIAWDVVARGVREVYRQARAARKRAKRSTRAFHAWRRRSKELTYQLELLAGYAGERTAALHREVETITDMQGPAVDLVMLRDLALTHSDGVPTEAVDHLADAIEDHLDNFVKAARRAGRDLFARKPRAFAKRLTKAVHRDLAPASVADDMTTD